MGLTKALLALKKKSLKPPPPPHEHGNSKPSFGHKTESMA